MKRNWNEIKWIFEPDGSLRDIYVQEVSLSDWGRLIDFLNSKYSAGINREYAIEFLDDESGEMEGMGVTIDLNGVCLNCHFFLPDQIEFDIDPMEVNSIEAFHNIEEFMEAISKALSNQVTLTGENSPEFPLVKIDYDKGINRVLTEQETKDYRGNCNSLSNRMMALKTKLQMKLFPNKFREKLLESANKTYASTRKDENLW